MRREGGLYQGPAARTRSQLTAPSTARSASWLPYACHSSWSGHVVIRIGDLAEIQEALEQVPKRNKRHEVKARKQIACQKAGGVAKLDKNERKVSPTLF